jgi:transmembrane sensor
LDAAALQAALARIERLRLRQEYAALARAIAALLPRVQDESLRETMSFELGDLLTRRVGSAQRACRHWRKHQREFGHSRYAEQIAEARATLGCR